MMLAAVAALLATPSAPRADTVYIESNRADANSLLAFDLSIAGILTAKNSISTSGTGVEDPSLALGPFDSDQEIIFSSKRSLLFAVNSGSNTIAVFHVARNGTLSPVKRSPFYSHGINPVSLGLKGEILTVVNKHQDPMQSMDLTLPNYTTFKVETDGTLKWTASSVEVAIGSSPSQALVTPFAPLVIGADFLGGLLRSFVIDRYGALAESAAIGLPDSEFGDSKAPHLPLGLAVHPRMKLLYVGFPTANKIGVYKYNWFGKLSFVRTTLDSGAVVCWLATNADGSRLYASNTADPSVTVYDISVDPENPKEIQRLNISSMGGAYQIALSPNGQKLIVLTQRFQSTTPQGQGNEVHVLNVDTKGMLEERVAPFVLDLPANTRPQGVVVL